MPPQPPKLTGRTFTQLSSLAAASLALPAAATAPDITPEIAPYTLEASPKHHFRTLAYNAQVPGPLLRMKQGQSQTIEVRNLSPDPAGFRWYHRFQGHCNEELWRINGAS